MLSLQTKRPKPSRPPPPIYEYVPSTKPSSEVKEQDKIMEMKAGKSEEQCLDAAETNETNERDLDVKLNMDEGQNLEVEPNENKVDDLEIKDNIAYCSTQKIVALRSI